MCMEKDTAEAIGEMKSLMWDFGLTKREAVAYVLHCSLGYTQSEIAHELGVNPSLISKRVSSARCKVNGE